MPQLDLIIDTYCHASPEVVAARVNDPSVPVKLWPQWNIEVAEHRGIEGVRWSLADPRFTGSTELWIEALPHDSCRLHAFVRVDRRSGPWPDRTVPRRLRRLRAAMTPVLWEIKDEVEASAADPVVVVPPQSTDGPGGRGVPSAAG